MKTPDHRDKTFCFPNQETERVEVFASGSKRGPIIRLHPLPNRDTGGNVAHVDWLALTLRPPTGMGVPWVFEQIERLTGLKVTKTDCKGFNGYEHGAVLGDFGQISWGGKFQRGTIHVGINGTGCSRVTDWRGIAAWGNSVDARITRVDLAHDDFEGQVCNIKSMFRWHKANGFNCGGRSPKLKRAGDWDQGDEGRTLYVGTRGNKLLRGYEKGKQLGDCRSRWFRVELALSGKNRVIPWEVLEVPGQYLAGSYPCLAFLSAEQSKIKTCQKGAAMSLDAMTKHASRLSGKAINVLMQENGEDAAAVVRKLRREGIPKRLIPYSTGLAGGGDANP